MADNIPVTGATVATDEITADSSHAQLVKLAVSADGSRTLVPAEAVNGLDVDVTRVQGSVTVVQSSAAALKVDAGDVAVPVTDNGASLTVDAPAAAPLAVRASDGASFLSSFPVSDGGGVLSVDDGNASLTVDGTVAATQSGTWNVGTVASITAPVAVTDNGGSLTVDDGGASLTVDGGVTAAQGAAAPIFNAWPVKITDGSDQAGLSLVSGGNFALKVDVVSTVQQAALLDKSGFTEGLSVVEVAGGVVNDTISADPGEDTAAALRLTVKRGLHANLRNVSGVEIATAANPLRVDPTGSTAQPVSGTVTATLSAAVVAGAAASVQDYDTGAGADNVLQVGLALPASGGHVAGGTAANPIRTRAAVSATPWRNSVTFSASQTGVALRTPAAGKKFVVRAVIISCTGAGDLNLHDDTDSATTRIADWTLAVGDQLMISFPDGGEPSAVADQVLKYTTGSGAAGKLTVLGYDTD